MQQQRRRRQQQQEEEEEEEKKKKEKEKKKKNKLKKAPIWPRSRRFSTISRTRFSCAGSELRCAGRVQDLRAHREFVGVLRC